MIDLDVISKQVLLARKNKRKNFTISIDVALDIIDRLGKAEKDAARYRFMRDSGNFLEVGSDFDAAIDEAMKCIGDDK